jgi:peroxiredoxin
VCAHCIEQLNVFGPMAGAFREAGVEIVAVSTDSADGLHRTFEKAKDGAGFPFPILADDSLATFKAYRAFDDFEKIPLHGTYLIDGAGLIRWQDIGYEPFRDAKWLLGETKRLLSIPAANQTTACTGQTRTRRSSVAEFLTAQPSAPLEIHLKAGENLKELLTRPRLPQCCLRCRAADHAHKQPHDPQVVSRHGDRSSDDEEVTHRFRALGEFEGWRKAAHAHNHRGDGVRSRMRQADGEVVFIFTPAGE